MDNIKATVSAPLNIADQTRHDQGPNKQRKIHEGSFQASRSQTEHAASDVAQANRADNPQFKFPDTKPTTQILDKLEREGLKSYIAYLKQCVPEGYILEDFIYFDANLTDLKIIEKNTELEKTSVGDSIFEKIKNTSSEKNVFDTLTDDGEEISIKPKLEDLSEIIVAERYSQKYGAEIFCTPRDDIVDSDIPVIMKKIIEKLDQHQKIGILAQDELIDVDRQVHTTPVIFQKEKDESIKITSLDSMGLSIWNNSDKYNVKSNTQNFIDLFVLHINELNKSSGKNTSVKFESVGSMPRQHDIVSCHTDALSILKESLRSDDPGIEKVQWNEITKMMKLPASMLKSSQIESTSASLSLGQGDSYSASKPQKTLASHVSAHSVNMKQYTFYSAVSGEDNGISQSALEHLKLQNPKADTVDVMGKTVVFSRGMKNNLFLLAKTMQYAELAMDFLNSYAPDDRKAVVDTLVNRRILC